MSRKFSQKNILFLFLQAFTEMCNLQMMVDITITSKITSSLIFGYYNYLENYLKIFFWILQLPQKLPQNFFEVINYVIIT